MVHVIVHVPWNKKIQSSVAIIVAKGCARGPVAQRDSRLFRDVGKGPVVIVVIQTILAEVRNVEIRPAVVIVVSYNYAETPAIVGNAGLLRNVGKRAVVVVVKQRRMGWRRLSGHGIVSRPTDQINVEPAVVVIIEQRYSRTYGLDDESVFGRAHYVPPARQSGFLRDVLEDDGPAVYKSPGGNRSLFAIKHSRMCSAG